MARENNANIVKMDLVNTYYLYKIIVCGAFFGCAVKARKSARAKALRSREPYFVPP